MYKNVLCIFYHQQFFIFLLRFFFLFFVFIAIVFVMTFLSTALLHGASKAITEKWKKVRWKGEKKQEMKSRANLKLKKKRKKLWILKANKMIFNQRSFIQQFINFQVGNEWWSQLEKKYICQSDRKVPTVVSHFTIMSKHLLRSLRSNKFMPPGNFCSQSWERLPETFQSLLVDEKFQPASIALI